jgi:tetratricopeptide (TPR) repeat protein
LLPEHYLQKTISVNSSHEDYLQTNPINFKATKTGRYENTIILKHRKNIAEEKLVEAERLREENSLEKAIKLVNQAIELSPQPRAYILKVQLIGQMLKTDIPLTPDLLRFGENMKFDENFQKFSTEFRHNFYLQLGVALAQRRYLEENKSIDIITKYYTLPVSAFDEAIALNSKDARAYQGKYLVQSIAGYYSDMISTIKEFFKQNPNVTNENVVKNFLTDWITGVEKITGYPKDSEEAYIAILEREPKYQTLWSDLLSVLMKYEKFYSEGDTSLDRRLKKAKLQAEKFLEERP